MAARNDAYDSPETVNILRVFLQQKGLTEVDFPESENQRNDCVFLALKYGVRKDRRTLRRIVRDSVTLEAVDLGVLCARDIRNAVADHICHVMERPAHPEHEAMLLNVQHEGRAITGMSADDALQDVIVAYTNAVRGELMGDVTVALAFASKFSCCVMWFRPPRRQSPIARGERSRYRALRPFMFLRSVPGVLRTTCTLMFYMYGVAQGHAIPLEGDCQARHFTAADMTRIHDPDYDAVTCSAIVTEYRRMQVTLSTFVVPRYFCVVPVCFQF